MSAETIFALASGRPPAGVAVIRVSGPEAGTALRSLTGAALPSPRRAVMRRFYRPEAESDDAAREPIDEGIALWFPAPASFTGEDVCEFHVHGGRAVIAAICDALLCLPGLRPAEPGEFSRRAYAFGKMDLTQAEALADLVAAETEAQRAQARRQLAGALGERMEDWRARLVGLLAHVEASVDFADEDIPADLLGPAIAEATRLKEEFAAFVDDHHRGERLRDGISVAILGAPNVGKSSLMNRLARRDVAIVAARAGTTRDVIEVHLDLSGLPVILADTAGLRETADEVEAEGVRRARARAAAGDLKLCVFDAQALPALDAPTRAGVDGRSVVVLNKSDLEREGGRYTLRSGVFPQRPLDIVSVSAKTGEGMAELEAALAKAAAAVFEGGGRGAPLTRARHRAALAEAIAALERVRPGMAAELLAEELRLAGRAIGRITGRIDVEDVLDVVFSEFCIGK